MGQKNGQQEEAGTEETPNHQHTVHDRRYFTGGHFGAPLRYITYNGRALPAGLSDPPALTDSETETWPADKDIDGEPPDYTGGIRPSYRSSCLSER